MPQVVLHVKEGGEIQRLQMARHVGIGRQAVLEVAARERAALHPAVGLVALDPATHEREQHLLGEDRAAQPLQVRAHHLDRKSTRLNSSHANSSYAVFCLKKQITAPPSST